MRAFTAGILEQARRGGAAYADVRVTSRDHEQIAVKNGNVQALTAGSSAGFGVRVLVDGTWGFAASSRPDAAETVVADALRLARAGSLAKGSGVSLSDLPAVTDTYRTPVTTDPFEVPLADKVALLLEAERRLHHGGDIRVGEARLSALKERVTFASTEGSFIEQELTECGAGLNATAVGAGEVQTRSYPNAHRGHHATRGYEFIKEMDLAGNAERVGREAVALLNADQCPPGRHDLVLHGTQLALQIHESCGHPVELDRVLGFEAGYAGTSFLTRDKLGSFRYGSPAVNIVADATRPGGLGTFAYDDEGVPAQRVPIISQGTFVNYLTSRETAPLLGQASNGTMRADGWNRMPIIRMTNINLEPGDWSFDELLRDTGTGIYMEINRSWSIDDKRLNFQFGAEAAWEIRDGSLGPMLKNPTYTGITPEFWQSCDAVAGEADWVFWGTPNCGKGEPSQSAHVGHGAAPARFRGVRVGIK